MNKLKLKKGDEVIVLAGKDKGKTGKIIKMLPKQMKAIVSEINNSNNFLSILYKFDHFETSGKHCI